MENKFLNFLKGAGLFDSIKGYLDTRIQLLKLEMKEKASQLIASLVFVTLLLFSFLMMVIFFSIALGNYLNGILDSNYWGYVILGSSYMVVAIILGVNVSKGYFHNKIKNMILNILNDKK